MAIQDTGLGDFGNFLTPEDILGGAPEETFFSFQNQFGRSGNQRRFFQGQFNTILDQFQGVLGKAIKGGAGFNGQPLPTFGGFLSDFDFNDQFSRIAPSVRGAQTSRFAPLSRFIDF
jgi:hypothetical protein